MLARRVSTVRGLMKSSAAISLVVLHLAISLMTESSAGARLNGSPARFDPAWRLAGYDAMAGLRYGCPPATVWIPLLQFNHLFLQFVKRGQCFDRTELIDVEFSERRKQRWEARIPGSLLSVRRAIWHRVN